MVCVLERDYFGTRTRDVGRMEVGKWRNGEGGERVVGGPVLWAASVSWCQEESSHSYFGL